MDASHRDALKAVKTRKNELARAVLQCRRDRTPDLPRHIEAEGQNVAVRDHRQHFAYLHEALRSADAAVFTNYVEWLRGRFENLSLPAGTLEEMLICMRQACREGLKPDLAAVYAPLFDAGLQVARTPHDTINTFIPDDTPLAGLAHAYLDALLNGDRRTAARLVLDAVQNGEPIKAIYLNVFQRSQLEVGRLWYQNKVSVAQEHYCSAATQMIMAQLYPYIFAAPKIGRCLVAACVGGELHEIGIRMVADFFELEGWDTYYLGANTPKAGLLQALEDQLPDLLALSATMPLHRRTLGDLIAAVRAQMPALKIMVGGYTLNTDAVLWRQLGADGHAADAQSALALGRRLTADTRRAS